LPVPHERQLLLIIALTLFVRWYGYASMTKLWDAALASLQPASSSSNLQQNVTRNVMVSRGTAPAV
jgi:hypothetical protein